MSPPIQVVKRVLVLLANGFEAFEAAAFIDVFGWATTFGTEPVEAVTTGLRPRLRCAFGFDVVPQARLTDLDLGSFDALAIPGGFEKAGFYEDAYSEKFLDVVRRFDADGKLIATICVAALPLAKSGVLMKRNATTYHLLEGRRRRQLAEMGAQVVDSPLVRDGNVITSTSPATSIDVALALLEELTSRDNANHIRTMMGFKTDDGTEAASSPSTTP